MRRGIGHREAPSDTGAADKRARVFSRRGADGAREQPVVPAAEFRTYYDRPVLKPPVWEWMIPAYLFTGGLSAGAAVLGAGADLTGRPSLRRAGRVGALGALGASTYLLVADLGRPERFLNMLRVAKPTSPMSVGTWLLVAYGPGAGLAGVAELLPARLRRTWPGRVLRRAARPAGLSAAAIAPGVASYTAVLLSHTAVPAWHEAHRRLPFVFAGSAAASGAGLGMVCAPVAEAGPARALGVLGAAAEVVAAKQVDRTLGFVGEAYTTGRAHRLRTWAERLTVAGAVGAVTVARRSRLGAVASGLALLAGSALQRFGVFEAGVASTKDPKYVVVPQRHRLAEE
ncbi:NrfD/PsrC family molybdoenzyme membrane anchor subunit [Actinophytocola sp. NPDC049390]|uniref:NrfD/PsrC family molybdoenzyme membrane anchor subunit n=1 Tax=Actinophytocola sp. NPDC049390 TaxID=3363894 RepID=UPI00378DCBE9